MICKIRRWVALACIALLGAPCVTFPALAQNIAIVNGTPIRSSRADALVRELVRQGQQDTPELQAAVREELVNRELLMQEAARRGILNRSELKTQLVLAQQNVIILALVQDFLKDHLPSDAELHTRYAAAVKKMGNKEYHLRHILVDNEAQAKNLIAKLKGGAHFIDLAQRYSKDASAKNGGDLDWSIPQNYVPEFAAAAIKLKKGEVTRQPVHTPFGWHIIQLDDIREIKVPPFDEVRLQLTQQMQAEKLQNFEASLRAHAKIQ